MLGYAYEDERQIAIQEFLLARHNGQSKDINDGHHDALAQVERAAQWRPTHMKDAQPQRYTPTRPISWIRENENRKTGARNRIKDALGGLKKLRRSTFTTVDLQQAAGCSRETLYNHSDIWRQDYEDLSDGFFEICTDEYNVDVGAGCPETKPPTAEQEKIAPPGLLAARRVVCEISMRTERDMRRARKQAETSSHEAETQWQDKVTDLTKDPPAEVSIERIKLLLVVLSNYLSLAPCEEAALPLQAYIRELRQELATHLAGPERAPP